MELKQLRLVCKVAEAGSFSKAALELNISHSRISRQISALEKECGERIFYRDGRGVRLTEFGKRILPEIDLVLDTVQQLSNSGAAHKRQVREKVRVGALASISFKLAAPLLDKIQKSHPGIILDLSEYSSGELQNEVLQKNLEIAIFLRNGTKTERNDRLLKRLECYVIGAPCFDIVHKDVVSISELAGVPLILNAPPNINQGLIDEYLTRMEIKLNIVGETTSGSSLRHVLLTGVGCRVVWIDPQQSQSAMPFGHEFAKGVLMAARIIEPPLSRSLVLRTSASPAPGTQIVTNQIMELMRQT